jgi:hypothetical protein
VIRCVAATPIHKGNEMTTTSKSQGFWLRTIAAGAVGLTLCGVAAAGCGSFVGPGSAPVGWKAPARGPSMMPTLYAPDPARFVRVGDDWGPHLAGIVGMWRVSFLADVDEGPFKAGDMVDFATIQYHADGNEFMISGGRAPSTGDVCMGVWKQTGERTYQVKHLALAWTGPDAHPPSATVAYLGPSVIHESIHLNHARNYFEGTFTIDQYAVDETTLLVHLSGKLVGARYGFD